MPHNDVLRTTTEDRNGADKPRGRMSIDRALFAELLSEIRETRVTTTEAMARLAGGIVNDVLRVETVAIPADGFVHRQFRVAAGVVEIRNLTGNDVVTVQAGPPSSAVPAVGVGVYRVEAGEREVIHLASRQFTVYGTATNVVCLQALTSANAAGGGS